ncbi:hypothetical protein [Sphingobium sp. LSP13-1-1.1]|uniref:hypothetical protein n=1 Tax=Sphingobium sp. LSP13-1-1.1 TaxID=3135234 RepID=UPI00343A523A
MSDALFDWGSEGAPAKIDTEEQRRLEREAFQQQEAKRIAREAELAAKRSDQFSDVRCSLVDELVSHLPEELVSSVRASNGNIGDGALKKLLTENADQVKQPLTHIWVGHVSGTTVSAIKSLLGYGIDKKRYFRARDHQSLRGLRTIQCGKTVVLPHHIKDVLFLRVTKAEAMKAKLATQSKQVVIEDTTGLWWSQLYLLVQRSKLKQDTSWYNEEWGKLADIIEQVYP